MKKIIAFIILTFIVCINLCSAQDRLKIAIIDLKAGVKQDQQETNGLADMMSEALFNSGVFSIVERSQVDKVIKEKRIKTRDLKSNDIQMVGKLLQVDAILTGTINFLHRDTRLASDGVSKTRVGEVNIDVRLISVETGELLSAAGGEIRGTSERTLVTEIASMLVRNMDRAEVGVERNTPFVLFDYLYVYPEDLGVFTSSPSSLIEVINKNNSFGFNNWRLPTKEELDALSSNKRRLRLFSNGEYAYDKCWSYGKEYNVRLVRTKVVVQQEITDEEHPYFEKSQYDFGVIQVLAGQVQTRFVLKNPSSEKVSITTIEKTSSAITASYSTSSVNPGDNGYVDIKFNPNGRQGSKFNYSIYVVLSNGQKEKLTIMGEIE